MKYRESLLFSLPLLFFYTYSAENLFRWYTGFAFIIFAIDYLKDKNINKFLLYSAVGLGFHIMLAPFVILVYFVNRLNKPVCPPLITAVLYIFVLLVFRTEYMLSLTNSISFVLSFLQSEHYQGYGEELETWIQGANRDSLQISMARDLINFLTYIFFVYVGGHVVRYRKEFMFYYNLMLIGVITYPALRQIELFDRYNQLFLFFIVIIGAYSLLYIFNQRMFNIGILTNELHKTPSIVNRQLLFLWGIFVILNFSLLIYHRSTPDNEYYTMFIWDAHGRTSIPTYYLKD